MFHRQICAFAVSLLSVTTLQTSPAAAGSSTKFPLPDRTVGLYIAGPNASGDVAGTYITEGKNIGHSYGFIRLADGTFIVIDAPASRHHRTSVAAIDDAGDVTGQYEDGNKDHAFVRTPDGTLTRFDAPGAYDTNPSDINARAGELVGWYYTADGNHGFIRTLRGTLTTIDYPGASGGTYPYAVNALGQIAGTYRDSNAVRHGFLREPDGTLKRIDPPNSAYTDNVVINDRGDIGGIYQDSSSGMYFAFLRTRGKFYTFGQYFGRLNARRKAVGQTFLLKFRQHRFETRPVHAPANCFNLFLDGIDDSGLIAGTMQCGPGTWFGYLRSL